MPTKPLTALLLFLASASAAVVAGCGGAAAGSGVASLGGTSTSGSTGTQPSKSQAGPHAFSACMRSHGVPNFPDPGANGNLTLRGGPGTGLDIRSPQFKAAQAACQKLLPNGGKMSTGDQKNALAQMLKFSACMRVHGLKNFPDPQASSGGIQLAIQAKSGLDPNSPLFKAAQDACKKYFGGPKGGPGPTTRQRSGP
ncbi:MAG TPA: hypothetical protein VFM96_01330 [Gaiellaceae bacterium]|nr:hypothetical protein [Gaiellaceae bacterium]